MNTYASRYTGLLVTQQQTRHYSRYTCKEFIANKPRIGTHKKTHVYIKDDCHQRKQKNFGGFTEDHNEHTSRLLSAEVLDDKWRIVGCISTATWYSTKQDDDLLITNTTLTYTNMITNMITCYVNMIR